MKPARCCYYTFLFCFLLFLLSCLIHSLYIFRCTCTTTWSIVLSLRLSCCEFWSKCTFFNTILLFLIDLLLYLLLSSFEPHFITFIKTYRRLSIRLLGRADELFSIDFWFECNFGCFLLHFLNLSNLDSFFLLFSFLLV